MPPISNFNGKFNNLNAGPPRHAISQTSNNSILGTMLGSAPPKNLGSHLAALPPQNLQFIGPPPIGDWSTGPLVTGTINGNAPLSGILTVGPNCKPFMPPSSLNENRNKVN